MNSASELKVGQVIRSKAGRDKGEWLVVTEIIEPDYVGVCNGINRKISNPKKKKVKHVAKTNYVSSLITNKLAKGIKITNSDIRSVLKPYNKKVIDEVNEEMHV